ncbi:MFS transporter [Streptomyces sp. H10-C2]|uniref:MFS transporter n=1 Tax=unclassified Streptomyces TaxID=2593676 RepID=UPI0024BAC99D|nr:MULTISPECIES: MFS transporter [unclassified Streptomyces]MDJ0344331.1 MFS transporter [Streptomyces sp. PH10-H1]MDJ0373700.1 MFS transporter [Streptomyces sp. H10-C2]
MSAKHGFALLGTLQATLIFTIMILMVPLPRIAGEFGLGPSELLFLSAAYGLSFSGLLLLGGRLTDRHGGRRMLLLGLTVFAAGSAAAALAPGFTALVAVRFAQGVGAALTAPAAMALVRTLFPAPDAYGRAMATWGGLSVLGATAGSLLSGVMTAWVSWRWAFAVPVVVALAGLVLAPRLLPADAPRDGVPPPLDLRGAVTATAGITAASYGLVATGEHPWTSSAVLVPLAAGLLLLTAFAIVERRANEPLLPPGFLAERRRATALAAIMVTAAGTALTFFLLSLYFQQVHGWTPLRTSAAFVPYAAALVGSGRAAGPLIKRYGARAVTAGGLAVGAAGLLLLAGLDLGSPYATGLLPGLLLLPAGAGPAFAGATVLATGSVPRRQTGLAAGVMNTAMELGPTIGLAALMSVAATRSTPVSGYAAAFAAAGTAYALTAVTAAIALRPRPAPITPNPPPEPLPLPLPLPEPLAPRELSS